MDWRNAGYQMAKGADDLQRDISIFGMFITLMFWILVFGIAVVVFQTVISWAVGLIGPFMGFILVGYLVLKVLAYFANS